LESLENITTPKDTAISIVVIENNSERNSETTVYRFSSMSRFKISYYLETIPGLAFARNRSVKEAGNCDFCCFVDDDQIVDSEWLVELMKCQREFNSDGVYGYCIPQFNGNVPIYIKRYHERDKHEYGTILNRAATGGLMLRKSYLDLIDGPFDKRFNYTGGEDNHLTYLISSMGGIIRFTPFAKVYEVIPGNRATINYVLKRNYQNSNIGLYVQSFQNIKLSRCKTLFELILRMCYGFLTFIPCLVFGKVDKLQGLVRIIRAAGGFAYFFGKCNQFYK